MEKKITNNKAVRHGRIVTFNDGSKYSIRDFGSLMASTSKVIQDMVFTGYEALRLDKDEKTVRANSFDEIIEKLR